MEPEEPILNETTPLLRNPEAQDTQDEAHNWWAELRLISEYSLPLIATYLLQYSFTVITTIVAGHLGSDDLAAASIGATTMNIIGFSIFEGMATALDTLCAQAYGSGNLTGVGLHLQRMILLMALACIPVGALWLFSPPILSIFIKQHDLALKAGDFLRVSLIGLPGYAFFEAGKRFLQAQGDFKTGMIILIICAPANAFLSWLFAFHLNMGLNGAALGAALSNDLRTLLLFLSVVHVQKWSHKCWAPFSRKTFQEWGPMVSLSLAGSAVNLGEWAAFEIVTFSTSYISTLHLAAQSILTTASVVMWHIPFSISVAVSTRIGHLIGAGLVSKARRASMLYALVFSAVGLFDGLFLFIFRRQLTYMFSDDPAVCDIAIKSMLAVGAFQLIDAMSVGCNGIMRGLGRQSFAAWVVFFVNYLAAVPLALWLELGSLKMGLDGVWIGLGIGMVAITAIETGYLKTIDWQKCIESVKEREGL